MPKLKQRTHNEYFRPVFLGGRKSCPECRARLGPGESIWSHGEYVRARWRTVGNFCKECWPAVRTRLLAHKKECGCAFALKGYHCGLPAWLTLSEACVAPGLAALGLDKPVKIF